MIQQSLSFTLRMATIGLAAAFLLLLWQPQLLQPLRPVVTIIERPAPAGIAAEDEALPSYAPAVAVAAPAVVNIYTQRRVADRHQALLDDPVLRHFFGERTPRRPRQQSSLGSGVVVSPEGYILTNHHVIEGAETIRIALHDGREANAQVVGSDPEADLALLRSDLTPLTAITLGHAESLRVGDVVLAIGNPFGVGQTVTMGIVSATGRSQLGINTFENFIQTDAAINPGNSGGALVNGHGDLVGINTAIFSRSGGSQGIGFAIPITLAKQSMIQLLERGRVSRGWLGIEIQPLTAELATSFGMSRRDGVVIAGVLRGGPAASAALRPGDILIAIDGTPIPNQHAALTHIAAALPGSHITLTVWRRQQTLQLTATVGERPPPR